MLAVITLCAGILSASPGCREITQPLFDQAATETACNMRLQELIAEKLPLYPEAKVGRWGCRHRKS